MVNGKPVKVIVVGSENSGKTLLLSKIATLMAQTEEIGVRFFRATIDRQALQIWEWMGADNPRSPKPGFYEGAHAAVVVYDARSIHSFEQAKVWVRVLKADYRILTGLLLANFTANDASRAILPQDGNLVASAKKFAYFEVNPEQTSQIEEAFRKLVENVAATAAQYWLTT